MSFHYNVIVVISYTDIRKGGYLRMWVIDLLISVTAGVAIFIICKWLDRNNNDN